MSSSEEDNLRKRVFVIFGRNDKVLGGMYNFLAELGLKPVKWSEMLRRMGKASPFIGEVVEEGFKIAHVVIVLLTGDDLAALDQKFWRSDDPDYERRPTSQPRQNVLFEAGMAFGKYPERTVLVQVGEVRPFTDVAGRWIVKLSNDPSSRRRLKHNLETAGCDVNPLSNDWLVIGDFDA